MLQCEFERIQRKGKFIDDCRVERVSVFETVLDVHTYTVYNVYGVTNKHVNMTLPGTLFSCYRPIIGFSQKYTKTADVLIEVSP